MQRFIHLRVQRIPHGRAVASDSTRDKLPVAAPRPAVALLTGGGDRPYVLGLTQSLTAAGVALEVIGSDFIDVPELRNNPGVHFLNLRGDMSPEASTIRKAARITRYYLRILRYAIVSKPRVFHILWNGRLEYLDRTVLSLFFRLCGKHIARTVHNVNAGKRDGKDGAMNRLTLRAQYSLCDHMFVHTEQMKQELCSEYSVPARKVSVIPFGINDTVPDTGLAPAEARKLLRLTEFDPVLLFFGNIAPYKGLEHLVEALAIVVTTFPHCCLVIAGRPKGSEQYWAAIERRIDDLGIAANVVRRIEYVPDAETEIYFKAADVLLLPYVSVFQSGVLVLGYNFGLPVIATNVASLKDDVLEGETGFVCEPASRTSLAAAIRRFLASDIYKRPDLHRSVVKEYAIKKYSWTTVADLTSRIYADLLRSSR